MVRRLSSFCSPVGCFGLATLLRLAGRWALLARQFIASAYSCRAFAVLSMVGAPARQNAPTWKSSAGCVKEWSGALERKAEIIPNSVRCPHWPFWARQFAGDGSPVRRVWPANLPVLARQVADAVSLIGKRWLAKWPLLARQFARVGSPVSRCFFANRRALAHQFGRFWLARSVLNRKLAALGAPIALCWLAVLLEPARRLTVSARQSTLSAYECNMFAILKCCCEFCNV